MKFSFNVKLTEEDYLEYNKFHMIRSPYGRGNVNGSRIIWTTAICLFILMNFLRNGFTLVSLLVSIPLFALLALVHIFIKDILAFSLKMSLKSMKKRGKMGYSPSYTIEFYDDHFIETTETAQTRDQYASIERVSIVGGTYYLHNNNIGAYIILSSSFHSDEERAEFEAFVKATFKTVDVYD
jgi:hypothetical protein